MSEGIYNMIINRGESLIRQFQYTDNLSNPLNISDYLAHLTVRDSRDYSAPALLDFYGGPQSIPLPLSQQPIPGLSIWGIAGLITFYISGALSLSLPWDFANYDLFLISPQDIRTKLLSGSIDVKPSIVHT